MKQLCFFAFATFAWFAQAHDSENQRCDGAASEDFSSCAAQRPSLEKAIGMNCPAGVENSLKDDRGAIERIHSILGEGGKPARSLLQEVMANRVHPEIVELLIKNHVPLHAVAPQQSLLDFAVSLKEPAYVEALVAAGVKPTPELNLADMDKQSDNSKLRYDAFSQAYRFSLRQFMDRQPDVDIRVFEYGSKCAAGCDRNALEEFVPLMVNRPENAKVSRLLLIDHLKKQVLARSFKSEMLEAYVDAAIFRRMHSCIGAAP